MFSQQQQSRGFVSIINVLVIYKAQIVANESSETSDSVFMQYSRRLHNQLHIYVKMIAK